MSTVEARSAAEVYQYAWERDGARLEATIDAETTALTVHDLRDQDEFNRRKSQSLVEFARLGRAVDAANLSAAEIDGVERFEDNAVIRENLVATLEEMASLRRHTSIRFSTHVPEIQGRSESTACGTWSGSKRTSCPRRAPEILPSDGLVRLFNLRLHHTFVRADFL